MPYAGYLEISGTRVIDNQLTAGLAWDAGFGHALICEPCPIDPAQAAAPWWDEAIPYSRDFLGLYGLEFTGVSSHFASRPMRTLALHGSRLGQLRLDHREIGVRAIALASSEAGLSYGLTWLSNLLTELGTGEPLAECWGTMAEIMAWCPFPPGTPPAARAAFQETAARRTLYEIGLLEGFPDPKVRTFAGGCREGDVGHIAEIAFTLAAGNPWLYGDPYLLASQMGFHTPTLWPCQGWEPWKPGTAGAAPDCTTTVAEQCIQWVPAAAGMCGNQGCAQTRVNVLQPDQTTGTGTTTLGFAIEPAGNPAKLTIKEGRIHLEGANADTRLIFSHPSMPGWPVLPGHEVEFTSGLFKRGMSRMYLIWLDSAGKSLGSASWTDQGPTLTRTAPEGARYVQPRVYFNPAGVTEPPPADVPLGPAQLLAVPPQPPLGAGCDDDPAGSKPVPPPRLPVPMDPATCIATMNPTYSTVRVEAGQVPAHQTMVPIIAVDAGVKPVRQFSLRIYRAHGDTACLPQELDECDLVAVLGVPYIGPGVRLVLDGRTDRMMKICPDGSFDDTIDVYNAAGAPLRRLPTFRAGQAWCVVAVADRGEPSDPQAVTATVSISAAPRMEAA
jgi:hypothetical protein